MEGTLEQKREATGVSEVYISNANEKGMGCCAAREFAPGEQVLRFGGSLLRFEEVEDFDHCLELPNGMFLGASGEADDFVNHSCEPNCYVEYDSEGAVMRALRRIERDEPLSFDYSLGMWRDKTTFLCTCGSPRCRGEIGPISSLADEVLHYYRELGVLPSVEAER